MSAKWMNAVNMTVELVEAREDSSEPLEPSEQALDLVAATVKQSCRNSTDEGESSWAERRA